MKISHLVLSAILLCISTVALAQKKISYGTEKNILSFRHKG